MGGSLQPITGVHKPLRFIRRCSGPIRSHYFSIQLITSKLSLTFVHPWQSSWNRVPGIVVAPILEPIKLVLKSYETISSSFWNSRSGRLWNKITAKLNIPGVFCRPVLKPDSSSQLSAWLALFLQWLSPSLPSICDQRKSKLSRSESIISTLKNLESAWEFLGDRADLARGGQVEASWALAGFQTCPTWKKMKSKRFETTTTAAVRDLPSMRAAF